MSFAYDVPEDDDLEEICDLCARLPREGRLVFGVCTDCCAKYDPDLHDDEEEDIDCDVCDGSGRVLKGEGLGMGVSLHCDDGGEDGDQTEDCGTCCGHGIINW